MEKPKVLIYDKMYPDIIPLLENQGFQVVYEPKASLDELSNWFPQVEGLIGRSRFSLNREILTQCKQLKWIGRSGAGLEDIDLEAADQKGICIINAPEGNRDAVGEHSVGLMLALLNHMAWSHHQVAIGNWPREESRGWELASRTVGLVGYGNMGKATAKRLSVFGCKILAFDPYTTQWDSLAQRVSLDQLQKQADMVSFHVPLTGETLGMFNSAFIDGFVNSFWLINTARGKVVNLDDLEKGLLSGKVKGAALDVLPVENPKLRSTTLENQIQRLSQMPQVLFTPHVAGWTFESYSRLNAVLAEKIKQYKEGGKESLLSNS